MTDWYDKKIENDKARALRHRCPECGSTMRGTGKLYFMRDDGHWFVEYLCEREQELFSVWAEETQKIAEALAHED